MDSYECAENCCDDRFGLNVTRHNMASQNARCRGGRRRICRGLGADFTADVLEGWGGDF